MSRAFVSGNSEYLLNNSALVAGPAFTMACWFYQTDDVGTIETLMWIGKKDTTLDYHNLLCAGNQTEIAAVSIEADFTNGRADSTAGYSLNTWNHACGVWAATNSRTVYLNGGNNPAPETTDVNPAPIDRVGIGANCDSSISNYLGGSIGEAVVWDAALTASEIASLAKGFSPLFIRPQNLVAYWPLVRGLNDKVGRYNLTANGTVVAVHSPIIYPAAPHIITALAIGPEEYERDIDGILPAMAGSLNRKFIPNRSIEGSI